MDYLSSLVEDYDNDIELEGKWTFYDNIWGSIKNNIIVERASRYKGVWGNSEKEWYTQIKTSNTFDFSEDLSMERIGWSSHREYSLSLLDNWKDIKTQILAQLEQAKATRNIVSNFAL